MRFILNFRKTHPNDPERNTINYEMVNITMPGVFLGSYIGVTLKNFMSEKFGDEPVGGENVAAIIEKSIFCLVVSWSIYITTKKTI